ncbi:hypothetical protein CPJCM30710_21880 [Clostridium polyendosporum]|uniref:Polymerase/histidinol phosphatase N-terminal domain-containing protein n=1 Tax=Clostridium polyendosporum TaxID=69208 RepID=A0A919VGT5_9CLOT|nr:CehA/McbA family metallohydrolase [Clostridium polyendosporum]GIM29522.1 hypothetical protein CPJCM30710_21880 [Clostridium polyendosporum]
MSIKELYNFYYGIPHAHTSYSDGFQTPTDAFLYARDKGLDFLIVTEHSRHLTSSTLNFDKTINISGSKNPKWDMLRLEADYINSKYIDFIAMAGFELSTDFSDHINILNSNEIIGKKCKSTADLYRWLTLNKDCILSFNHPFRINKILNYCPNLNKYINLFEIGHGAPPRPYTRCLDLFYKALDKGWHLGAINGQDNHINNWGDYDNVTCVICKTLNHNSIIEALRSRRVYSTESRSLKLTYKINDHWMGSIIKVKANSPLNFYILAEDRINNIKNLQIISSKGQILDQLNSNNTSTIDWQVTLISNASNWYLIKVTHCNDKISVSSPIFIENS